MLLALGTYLMLRGFGAAMDMAAIWLLAYTGTERRAFRSREMI